MPLTVGQNLGPYRIVTPLGAGGMGEVYRAHDEKLGRDVAIKVLPEGFARDAGRLGRFRREAQSLAALNHPNVASIYGLEDATGTLCLVLELVEGETLSNRLGRGPLSLQETLALAVQVAEAIEAAHERGIVHRDLKPGNVMVSDAGRVKVLDFGLAKSEPAAPAGADSAEAETRTAMPAATEAGVILGTAAYMSPEQARGRAVDRRSDVWSFGCLLYECLAGRPAFAGETVSDLVARILEREPDWSALPAGTPPRVLGILRRCLRKNADERPRDIRDVRLELAEVASGGARGGRAEERSIAVLPFENLSGPDDEYFADGVADEILNALAQLEGLRVAARSSCFAFKGRREDPRVVGERLGVTTVLEGTVRRSGQRLRVTAQLVNVADGYQMWSERYDRELTDVFAVQDEIAEAIARKLSVALRSGGGARRGTANLEAYELVLKGRAFQLRRGRFIANAIECFERAIELDPQYADAMGLLADSWRLLGTFGARPASEIMPRARDLAERALALDPSNTEACATLADVEAQYEWDFDRADRTWRRAFAVDARHTRSRCERAIWGYGLRRFSPEESVRLAAEAVADDPLNAWAITVHSMLLAHAGRHTESVTQALRAEELEPEGVFGHYNLVRALAWSGDFARARSTALGVLAPSGRHPWVLGSLAWTFGQLGESANARAVFDELAARRRYEHLSASMVALAASSAGLADEAFAWASRAAGERDPVFLLMPGSPFFDDVVADSRFEALARQVWT